MQQAVTSAYNHWIQRRGTPGETEAQDNLNAVLDAWGLCKYPIFQPHRGA